MVIRGMVLMDEDSTARALEITVEPITNHVDLAIPDCGVGLFRAGPSPAMMLT